MSSSVEERESLREALRLMTQALDIVDHDGSVGAIGAQLDLARARLSEHLDQWDAVRSN